MMPRSLTRLLAQFCEGFGQTCYMIKISGKWRHIWLYGTVEKRFKSRQSFCTESFSTRLLSNKPDHKHPWLNHGLLELSLPNSCFATFYRVRTTSTGGIVARRGKVGVTNVTITRRSHCHTSTISAWKLQKSNSHWKVIWTIPSPTVNPETS
jgi:hypothetical protein